MYQILLCAAPLALMNVLMTPACASAADRKEVVLHDEAKQGDFGPAIG